MSEMNNLLSDWIGFCEGSLDFDRSHFYPLFTPPLGESEARLVFGCLPQHEALLHRYLAFVDAIKNKALPQVGDEARISESMRSYVNQLRNACIAVGDTQLAQLLADASIRFENDSMAFEAARQSDDHLWLLDTISDYCLASRTLKTSVGYAIFEAFYGAANDFDIQWFLGKPLMDVGVDFWDYLELWKLSVSYAFCDGEILVCSER